MRAISSITSISRVTSRKRGGGTRTSIVPWPARGSKPSRSRISTARASDTSSAVTCATRSMRTRSGRARRAGRPRRRAAAASCAPPQSSTRSRAAAREATGAIVGSTPFSQRLEPSVRRPELLRRAQDLRAREVGGLEHDRVGRLADLGLGAAHDAAEALRALARRRSRTSTGRARAPARRACAASRRPARGAP